MSTVYVFEQGAKLSVRENRLIIEHKDLNRSLPIETIDGVVVMGHVMPTVHCMETLLEQGIHMNWLSQKGRYFGRLESTRNIRIQHQRLQFRCGDDTSFCCDFSKRLIEAKIKNQKVVLRRYNRYANRSKLDSVIHGLDGILCKLNACQDMTQVLGYEGIAARQYFEALGLLVTPEFAFKGRTRRPPKDPINAALSFGYTLLMYEVYTALAVKGLNPYAALMHQDHPNHPAMASDIMEPWRPILVDAAVMHLNHRFALLPEHFERFSAEDKEGVKVFLKLFEEKLHKEVVYFEKLGHRQSFRNALQTQLESLIRAMESRNADLFEPVLIR